MKQNNQLAVRGFFRGREEPLKLIDGFLDSTFNSD
jgi:hypothetical protein